MTGSSSSTYTFSAFSGADLVGSSRNYLAVGRTFVMPTTATSEIAVKDNDNKLSGEGRNERAADGSKQTADIDYNGHEVRDDAKIYAEQVYTLLGSDGKIYKLLEIEIQGASRYGNDKVDFYTFVGAVPPAGTSLKVTNVKDVGSDGYKYSDLGAGAFDTDPEFGSGTTSGTVTEKKETDPTENTGAHTTNGTIAFTDNKGDSHTVSVLPSPGSYKGALTASLSDSATPDGKGTVTWTFSVDDDDLDYLAEGQEVTQTYTIKISDSNGDSDTKTVTIKLKGRNDDPTAIDDSGSVVEAGSAGGGDPTANGNVLDNDLDPDLADSHKVIGVKVGDYAGPVSGNVGSTIVGIYGTLKLKADGTWTYLLNNSDPQTQALAQGETATDVFSYTMKDEEGAKSTAQLIITVTGSNDGAPQATGDTASVDEDSSISVAASGVLANDSDVDGDTLTVTQVNGSSSNVGNALAGTYGTLTLNADGSYDYDADQDAADAIAAGESRIDSFTYQVSDGNGGTDTATLKITVNGINDVAVIAGDISKTIAEDTDVGPGDVLTTAGALTIDDPDAGQSEFVPQASTAGSNGYGTFTLDADGNWTYTADNTNPAIQDLAVDESLTDSFTAVSSDGSASQVVTVTINGQNDVVYTVDDTVDPSAQDGGFLFAGNGIPPNGFGLANQTDVGIELGLQVIYRQGPVVTTADDYADNELHFTVNDGYQSTENGSQSDDAGRASWSFEYSIATGVDGETGALDDYTFFLKIDVDPTTAVSYHVLQGVPGANGQTGMVWVDTSLPGSPVVISDDEGTLQVAQNSQNYAFYDLFTGAYNEANGFDGPAEFDLVLEAYRGSSLLASNHIVVDVEVQASAGQVLVLDENGNIIGDFTTIQDAVDSLTPGSSAGYTVLVGAGSYEEQVVVDGFTDLTIKADGAVTVEAPDSLVQTATSSSGRELFAVITVKNSTNIDVIGIDVDGDGNGNAVSGSNPNFIGVLYRDASGELNGVDITGIRMPYEPGVTADGFPIQSGIQRGVGLQVDNSLLLTFAMIGGSISDFQKNATVFNNADLNVSGVTITGGGAQTINAQNGIQAQNSTGTITGNTITAIGYAGPGNDYSGSILLFDNADLNVTNNVIDGPNDATTDAKVVGVFVWGGSGGQISGNTISDVDTGVGVYGTIGPNGIAVHDNTVSGLDTNDPFYAGVDYEPNASATVYSVEGTDDHDIFLGGTGADTFTGLGGDDAIIVAAGADHAAGETINGGGDIDSIAFSSTTDGDALVLQSSVTDVENVYLGSYLGEDVFDTSGINALDLDASAVANGLSVFGNDGDNVVIGTGFADTVYGHGGDDTIAGGGGDDAIYGGDAGITDGSDSDTAIFADTLEASDFSYNSGTGEWTVVTDTEGTDTLKGIEKVVDGAGNVFLLVDQNPAGGYATIQAAIDAAADGETILIAPGTYVETSVHVPGDLQGLYINKPNLTLQGFSSADGSIVTTAAEAQASGPTVIAAAENTFGANHWVDVGGDGVTINGLHLQAGAETGNKLLEIWADDVTVTNNFLDVYDGGTVYTYAVAVYVNDNGPISDEITAYAINGNILNEGVVVSNGVGEAGGTEPAPNQTINNNSFIGTFDEFTGEGRYDTIVLNGAVNGIDWLTEAVQIPTIVGNTIDGNSVPFILRGSDNDAANLPTAGQIQAILDANGGANLQYAYVVEPDGDLATAARNDGFGDYFSFAVTNTIDTLNLALDPLPDAVFGGQRQYIHAGDTVVVQSGVTGTVNSEIMVENLKIEATANSGDLNLTLATQFANGSAIAGGGVHNITLVNYAAGLGANVDVTGNNVTNAIFGNSGANIIRGMGSNDTFAGGAGDDVFVFGLPEASDGVVDVDTIIDFGNGNDAIDLQDGVTADSIVDYVGYVEVTLSGDGDKIIVTGATSADLFFT